MVELTREKLKSLLDDAFNPQIKAIQDKRALIEEYYQSQMQASKFALSKQKTVYSLTNLLKKYHLPTKVKLTD